MNLCVFGLGYVGCVSAAGFATHGHRVVGVDIDESKVSAIRAGTAPIVEPGLDDLISSAVESGDLLATVDGEGAVNQSDLSLICVGTPSGRGGEPDTSAVQRVLETVGASLRKTSAPHTVVVRSTILPGTSESVLIPVLERASGRSVDDDLGFAFNPEFLREGSSLADFESPPKTVIGARSDRSHDTVSKMYEGIPGPVFHVPIAVAEMAKYADNFFHALKVCFANEIGSASRVLGLDSHEVMEIFKADERLNISTAYLAPGFAFGGSCLPKDVRALAELANREHLDMPILNNVIRANEAHLQRAFDLITGPGERRIGMFGLAFKSATDDLRESPFVELAERLIGKGFDLKIYDPVIAPSRLIGTNRRFVERHLPHLSALLVDDPDEVVAHARVLVVGNRTPPVLSAVAASRDKWIVDLVRMPDADTRRGDDNYVGIAW